MTFVQTFLLALIEGLTEFLPISSTGHLILTQNLIGLGENDFTTQFNIIIQFGAILSVLVLYRDRFFKTSLKFYIKLFVAFLPAAIIGLAIKDKVDALLHSVTVVAWALIVGGAVLIWFDKWTQKSNKNKTVNELLLPEYFKIGLFQCLAFVPGVSRSGASILGGLVFNLSKKEAAEFSFFLAVPTLAAASLYKLLKVLPQIQAEQIQTLSAGFFLSFIFAMLAIKFFIHWVSRSGFFWFGVYRIVLGSLVLVIQNNV